MAVSLDLEVFTFCPGLGINVGGAGNNKLARA